MEYRYDPILLYEQLKACGVNSHCDALGNVNDSRPIAELIKASYDKPLSSPEAKALCEAVGGATDERWLNYRQVRIEPIRRRREARYRAETDHLLFHAMELDGSDRDAALAEWKQCKEKIRATLPYPE